MHDTPTPGTSDGKFHGRQYNTNSNIFNPTLSQNSGLIRVTYIYIYVCYILVLVSSHN